VGNDGSDGSSCASNWNICPLGAADGVLTSSSPCSEKSKDAGSDVVTAGISIVAKHWTSTRYRLQRSRRSADWRRLTLALPPVGAAGLIIVEGEAGEIERVASLPSPLSSFAGAALRARSLAGP
jgi:hypothetical protein